MKYTNENLNLENGLKKEWIITNGIGGYSSSTIIGANTRKYHGLLIAPLTPPARRFLILSKLDESIKIGENNYNLYTNVCKDYISDGYKYLTSFEKEYIPNFKYKINDVLIEKEICMVYGKNTVCVLYKIKNGEQDAILTLTPVVNFKDFHTMTTNYSFTTKQQVKKQKIKLIINENSQYPIYMLSSEGEYIEYNNNTFDRMYYIEEEKRGFFPEENHSVPGSYRIYIPANSTKEISFICSLEENIDEIDIKEVIKNEKNRIDKIIKKANLIDKKAELKSKDEKTKAELIKYLIMASDNFIVYRPSFGLHTIIAGYPWFLDWGRDSLIAFEGLLLVTKRFDIAKEILLTMIKDIKFGLVPNGYSGFDNRPLYNSVDASLLLFEQVHKYLKYTNDNKFVEKTIYPVLKDVINAYINRIDLDDNNIYLDKDYLLVSGTENTQNTWMDAKIGNYVVTPRNGKAVEINSMWYNALKILEELSKKYNDEETCEMCANLAKKCKTAFTNKFYNKTKKCLYDILGDSKIRPNQLFSISLTYPILNPNSEIAKEMFETVTKKLLKKHGLKTLAKGEENYVETYEGDSFRRDMSYHQGITWVWLLGVYSEAFKNIIKAEKTINKKKTLQETYEKFVQDTIKTFYDAITKEGCIGSISELYDSKPPYLPKGAFAQAWSVSEILKIVLNEGETK